MRTTMLVLGLGLGLAACADVNAPSGPPPAGASAGPVASPEQQQTRGIAGANSPNASAGTPSFTGTQGTRPNIEYSGGGTGPGIGGATSPAPPVRSQGRPN